jgi:hypothetical protein
VLTLQPGGPPGTAGTSVVDSAGPPPLPTNFQFYRDTNDGWLKVISAAGNIYQLFPT